MVEHTLSRKPTLAPATVPKPKTPSSLVHHATASGGGALDAKTQREMGSRFGHDFSQVRIHTSARAAESAQSLGANAYAVGSDIVFGPGRYAPGSREGDRLIAHELTHVAQQAKYGLGHEGRLSRKGDASEQEADALAAQVLMSQALTGPPIRVQAMPQAAIARDGDDNPTVDAEKSFVGDVAGMIPILGNLFNVAQVSQDIEQSSDPGVGAKGRSMGQTNTILDGASAIPIAGNVLSAGRAGWDLGSAGLRLAGANPNYAPTSGEAFNDLMGLF